MLVLLDEVFLKLVYVLGVLSLIGNFGAEFCLAFRDDIRRHRSKKCIAFGKLFGAFRQPV